MEGNSEVVAVFNGTFLQVYFNVEKTREFNIQPDIQVVKLRPLVQESKFGSERGVSFLDLFNESAFAQTVERIAEPFVPLETLVVGVGEEVWLIFRRRAADVGKAEADKADGGEFFAFEEFKRLASDGDVVAHRRFKRSLPGDGFESRIAQFYARGFRPTLFAAEAGAHFGDEFQEFFADFVRSVSSTSKVCSRDTDFSSVGRWCTRADEIPKAWLMRLRAVSAE